MRLPKFFLWLVGWVPFSLCAAYPRSVVITDDRVVISGSVIAIKEPKQEFQISRNRITASLGMSPKILKSWSTSEYSWDDFGIALQYRDDIKRCTSLRFDLRHARYLATLKQPYAGMISVNGVPITPLTDSRVFQKIGFKKSPEGYTRTVGSRETVLWVDALGHIARVTIDLPKIVDRSID
jgi:hypothetical protein